MSNVSELPTVIWRRLEDNARRSIKNLADGREAWADIAEDMLELRGAYKSDLAFGVALAEHDIDYGKNDRAALIWMGKIERSLLLDAIDYYQHGSPRYLVMAMKESGRFDDPVSLRRETGKAQNLIRNSAPMERNSPSFSEESCTEEVVIAPTEDLHRGPKSAFEEKPAPKKGTKASILKGHYSHSGSSVDAIKVLLSPRKTIDLLVDAVRDGKLGDENKFRFGKATSANPRLFFDDYPDKWVFRGVENKNLIHMIDDIAKHHERCGGDMSKVNCNTQWATMQAEAKAVRVEAAMKATRLANIDAPKITCRAANGRYTPGTTPVDAASDTHQDIIVCGKVVWVHGDPVGYTDAWKLYMLFKFFERGAAKNINDVGDIKARVSASFRNNAHYMRGMLPEELVNLWGEFCNAQHTHPDCYAESSAANKRITEAE